MAITSNLYPPIVPDILPAIVRTNDCYIYFSISPYNSLKDDIDSVQISITNQRTNSSILKPNIYPSGIKIGSINLQKNTSNDYNYYTIISKDDIIGDGFSLDQFYKIQLRFTAKNIPADTESTPEEKKQGTAYWFYSNSDYFSEWSKVCLIKGISEPKISLRGFENIDISNQETVFTTSLISIIGELTYADPQETEYLKNYNIKIYQSQTNNLVVDSGDIYTNQYNPNEINYQLLYDLLDGVSYKLVFSFTTNNLYSQTESYNFRIVEYGADVLNANIIKTIDENNGRVKINIVSNDNVQHFIGNITIRRSSSKSNFHKWEDVHTVAYTTGNKLNYIWYDNTIESGIWYKYCAQRRNAIGGRGAVIGQNDPPVMCIFDDIFLTRKDCQLKIQLNPSLNEFKYNVAESQQTTIGAKYPFIKRNGNNYFRTFPIGGLISSFIDDISQYDLGQNFKNSSVFQHSNDENNNLNQDNKIHLFTSREKIFSEQKSLYDEYNINHNINEYNDFIYEREFRNQVYDFLYKNNVKLFRSTTEGNILIKLMNIDFQPVESLGRRLYSFTATAVQIDEATISNYDKYDIQPIGNYEEQIFFEHDVFGQLQDVFSKKDGNLLNRINLKYQKSANQGLINEIEYLKSLKLEIESEPYVIIEENGELKKAETTDTIIASNATVGHIVQINGIKMIIYPKLIRQAKGDLNTLPHDAEIKSASFFELKDDNTIITDLQFIYPTKATIDYVGTFKQVEDTSNLFSQVNYYNNIGQLYNTFTPKTSLIQKIYNKYFVKTSDYYQQLLNVNNVTLESLPGAVVYVKDSKDSDFNRHILENGYLQLKDDEVNIEGLYFCGIHLTECENPFVVNGITDFVLQEGVYNNFNELLNLSQSTLVNGGIYQIKTYGILDNIELENHKVLIINDNNYIEIEENTPDMLYKLIIDKIENDESLQYVYYYGCWYLLKTAYEKKTLSKYDIRTIRENEFFITNESYDSINEIKNPIQNGVYRINSYFLDNDNQIPELNFNKNLNFIEILNSNITFNNESEMIDINSDSNVKYNVTSELLTDTTKETILSFNEESGLLTLSSNYIIENTDNNYFSLLVQQLTENSNQYIYYHNKWYPFTNNHDVICPVNGIVDYEYEVMKGSYFKHGI